MKRSRYTHCITQANGDFILYNAATGAIALCDKAHADILEVHGADESVSEFGDPAPATTEQSASALSPQEQSDVIETLSACGFLVEDDRDELAEQRAVFEASRKDRSQLWLAIAPTYACNCRCAYCYEQDKLVSCSLLPDAVEQAIYRFVEEQYDVDHYTSLFVEWYGGDPQLCLDLVERMSGWFHQFCDARAISYNAMMLSNATRIKADEAKLLSDARISSMLITLDGPEDIHNERRPAVDVDNPFQAILSAIGHLQDQGIYVGVAMNTDKVNLARLDELREALSPYNIEPAPTKLNDYSHTFNALGENRFCKPKFDLFNHEEFAHANFEQMRDRGFTSAQLKGLLSPCDHFCSGQKEASYVIDARGDVYKCDGWMGDKTRSIFNLVDGSVPVHDAITFNPFEAGPASDTEKTRPDCSACDLLPVCWGNCSWERERCDWPCHPLKHTLGDYLEALADLSPARTDPFQLL